MAEELNKSSDDKEDYFSKLHDKPKSEHINEEPEVAEPVKQVTKSPKKVATDCKACVFHNIKGFKCYLGKLDKYIENGAIIEERDGQYLIDRICLFRKDGAWKSASKFRKNIERAKAEALNSVKISGTVVVYADKMESLEKCIQSLSTYPHIKNFKVVVAHFDDLKIKEVYDYITDQEHIENVIAIQIKDKEDTNFLDEAIRHSQNGLIITLDSDKGVDLRVFDKLQKFLYEDMKRLLYIQPSDGIHELVVQGVLYKFLKGNKFFTFDEKIKELAKEQNVENQILTWKDVDESIS